MGDEPSAWRDAGFQVVDGRVRIATTDIVLDPAVGPGVAVVHLDGIDGPVDGLPLARADAPRDGDCRADHPNRVVGLDHLVAMSPAVQRTSDALVASGLERRRTRTFPAGTATRRQDFFWMGDVILELVGIEGRAEPGPAAFWGLALSCDDLDAAADHLGPSLGSIKDAVQPGRRIATVRTRDLGVSVPIALMSPHPGNGDRGLDPDANG